MIVKLKKAESPYEAIDRETIQKIENPDALAIWVYLLSKPNDWNVCNEEIKDHFKIGETRRLKAFKELRELGLYEVVREKKDGCFTGSHIIVYPQLWKVVAVESGGDIKVTENITITENNKRTERSPRKSKKFVPPTLDAVTKYLREKKMHIDPKTFYDYFEAGKWHDSNGNPVKNWKQKAITWESHNKKDPTSVQPQEVY